MRVFVEDWAATYGSPYLVAPDDTGFDGAVLVEDGDRLVCRDGADRTPEQPVAFVDGVRRGEAWLYQEGADGAGARGVAGSHACGAVLADRGRPPVFGEARISRLIVWGSGCSGALPTVRGGWAWEARSIADPHPDAPLRELQTRMREAEGRLAEDLCRQGFLVLVDGPLTFVRSRDLPVAGYVKTHHRALLDPERHRQVPTLAPGQRTSLFALGSDRYSTYLRLARRPPDGSPWSGIVRIEVPQSAGLGAAAAVADRLAAVLPRYAGVAHRDPRAPQNLQPVGALERHLRHLLGSPALAARAVHEAVAAARRGGQTALTQKGTT